MLSPILLVGPDILFYYQCTVDVYVAVQELAELEAKARGVQVAAPAVLAPPPQGNTSAAPTSATTVPPAAPAPAPAVTAASAASAPPSSSRPATTSAPSASRGGGKPPPGGDSEEFIYATKDEAREAFKQMLNEAGCQSSWPWDKVMRHVANEPRWNALKRVNEKKQCYNAWKPVRAKQEKEELRIKVC